MADLLERFRQWEKTRQMGRRRFVWRNGLSYGLPGWISLAIVLYWDGQRAPLWFSLPWLLILSIVGSYLIGIMIWRDNERKYLTAIRDGKYHAAALQTTEAEDWTDEVREAGK